MTQDQEAAAALRRHQRIVLFAILTSVGVLTTFRASIELGFGPGGSLRIASLPLEYIMLAWFFVLLALWFDARALKGPAGERAVTYELWLGVAGLAAIFWLAQRLGIRRLLWSEAWVYPFAAGAWLTVFISASAVAQHRRMHIFRAFVPDALRILNRPATWVCLLGALLLLAQAPRTAAIPVKGWPFQRWYSARVIEPVPASWRVSPVTLIELTDYQCPVCREAARRYETVIRSAEEQHRGLFAYRRVDFPLENECNSYGTVGAPGGLHLAACEAAVAVRLARQISEEQARNVMSWLWLNQRLLTRDTVFDGVKGEFGIDVRARYADVLPEVVEAAGEARRLQVAATPTFFLNGRRLPFLPEDAMAQAIQIEVQRVNDANQPVR